MTHLKIFSLLLLLLAAACANPETTSVSTRETTTTTTTTSAPAIPAHTYYASYVGDFEADPDKIKDAAKATYTNKINITITSLEDGKALGRSIIAGNDRPFEGSYTQDKEKIKVIAKEPGDDAHDGRFEFTLDTVKQEVSGKWFCNDAAIAVPVRMYTLGKKTFNYIPESQVDSSIVGAGFYDPKDETGGEGRYEAVTKKVLKYNASTNKLNKKDIENLYKGDLEIIRNAIYARHGYSFRNRRMRYMFDNFVSWYVPVSIDVRAELTELEKENIALLKRYEDHAGKYYDEFSR